MRPGNERRRDLWQLGIIDRVRPGNGTTAAAHAKRNAERADIAAKELTRMALDKLPALADKEWDDQDAGEKLNTLLREALEVKRDIFAIPRSSEMLAHDPRLATLINAASDRIIEVVARAQENAFRQIANDELADLLRRIDDAVAERRREQIADMRRVPEETEEEYPV